MFQSFQIRLFITGMLSTMLCNGYAQQSMLISSTSTIVPDPKVDLKESKDSNPAKNITIKNRATFFSTKEHTVRLEALESPIEIPFKFFSDLQNHKNENKKLKLEGKFTFNKGSNLYAFIPGAEYYPIKKVGIHLTVLMGSPDVIHFRINQIMKTYSIKLSLIF